MKAKLAAVTRNWNKLQQINKKEKGEKIKRMEEDCIRHKIS